VGSIPTMSILILLYQLPLVGKFNTPASKFCTMITLADNHIINDLGYRL